MWASIAILLGMIACLPTISAAVGTEIRPPARLGVTTGPLSAPLARAGALVAYDAADGYTLLFGGVNQSFVTLSDTWVYQGGNWTQLHPRTNPPGRTWSMMTYDTNDGYVLLFGGMNHSTGSSPYLDLGDTWTFRAGVWTRLNVTSGPVARDSAMLADDPLLNSVLLFGGSLLGDFYGNTTPWFNDTWEFHNGSWSALHPAGWTPRRMAGSMTYFPRINRMVLFGGEVLTQRGREFESHAVITFDNATWRFVNSTGMAKYHGIYSTMVFLPHAHELFYVTGGGGTQNTWAYSNHTWRFLSSPTTLPLQPRYAMAYDGKDGYVLLFGGYASNNLPTNLTWQYSNGNWHRV